MSSYNGEKYIKEQLKSIQTQERPADEVLIRDDGSTDNTVEIVRQFIKAHHLENWRIEPTRRILAGEQISLEECLRPMVN